MLIDRYSAHVFIMKCKDIVYTVVSGNPCPTSQGINDQSFGELRGFSFSLERNILIFLYNCIASTSYHLARSSKVYTERRACFSSSASTLVLYSIFLEAHFSSFFRAHRELMRIYQCISSARLTFPHAAIGDPLASAGVFSLFHHAVQFAFQRETAEKG